MTDQLNLRDFLPDDIVDVMDDELQYEVQCPEGPRIQRRSQPCQTIAVR